jgi:hypothetical protein
MIWRGSTVFGGWMRSASDKSMRMLEISALRDSPFENKSDKCVQTAFGVLRKACCRIWSARERPDDLQDTEPIYSRVSPCPSSPNEFAGI